MTQTKVQMVSPDFCIGPKCLWCGNYARLENGDCVTCAAREEAAGRSRADALLVAAGKRYERQIDQARQARRNA